MIALATNRLILGASEASPQQWLILLGIVVFLIFLLNARARRRTRVHSPAERRHETQSSTRKRDAIHRDIEQLLVELNDLARQINAQIDTRFAKLEQSIADADKRIRFLRVLLEAAKQARLLDLADPDLLKLAGELAEQPQSPQSGGRRDSPASKMHGAGESRSFDEEENRPAATKGGNDAVYVLADQGRTIVEIAQALGRSIGEVELILNLRDSAAHR